MADNMHDTALAFICRHAAEHLHGADLVKRTADNLTENKGVSSHIAFETASQAWAEFDGRGSSDWIDVSRTTSHCVLLHRGDGETVAFTAAQLNRAAALLAAEGVALPGHR